MKGQPRKTARKLILFSILPVVVFFAISNIYGLIKVSDVQEAMHWVTEYHVPLMKRVTTIDWYQHEQERLFERLLCEKAGDSKATHAPPDTGNALRSYEALSEAMENAIGQSVTLTERAIESSRTESRREAFDGLAGRLAEVLQRHQALDESTREVLGPQEDRDANSRQRAIDEITDARHRNASRLEQLLIEIEKLTEQEVLDAQRAEEQAYLWMLVFTALALSGFAAAFRAMERLCREQP